MKWLGYSCRHKQVGLYAPYSVRMVTTIGLRRNVVQALENEPWNGRLPLCSGHGGTTWGCVDGPDSTG
ncbi:MAG: hypothetical protein J6U08_05425 [Paludibacteraceae bacterium]|nr:hypothetical protein [Paludibacteraceae bacterium]